ncbi:MAG: 2-oxoacid:acceptor oxidoreductase family protein [Deltaproteobacteria bacterium]|nr:2-oxoacid:acceptor oxidoreductase family protein [Candidatus Anaeroferrophillus wilburensis]MBN2888520.1 2-oxoacid:acceptor oxidoreductase family protein [Deltaproteobacteria bacterium]
MKQGRTEIRLAGSGGQGLITAGIILAEAAIFDGKNVVQSQSYGPEARGGASKAEVIIADGPISYPKATWVDIFLAMSQKACDQYLYDLTVDGTFIADTTYVTQVPTSRALTVPISGKTTEKFGKELFSNIVALGVLVGATGVVTRKAIETAVLARVPKGTENINSEALNFGFQLAAQALDDGKEDVGEIAADD